MKTLLSRKNMPILLCGILLLFLAVCIVVYFGFGGYIKIDVIGHWRICKYTLEGYNPYLIIDNEVPLESVGRIPKGFSTVPWSCVLGSVFYGGFMPLAWAEIYLFVLHFLALLAVMVVIYRKFKPIMTGLRLFALLLLPAVHFSFTYSLRFGNAGGVICCLLVIALLIVKERPVTAGILLGFAMMKPQISAIICLVFLFKKQWKPLFITAGIVFVGWCATAIATSTDLLQLLVQTFESGTASSGQYLGLLNNLKFFHVNSKLILLFNATIGVAYTAFLFRFLKKRSPATADSPFIFVPACIASTFWIYKNGTDYAILAFAAIFFCLLCVKKDLSWKDRLASLFSIGFLQMSRCVVYVGVLLFEDNLFVRDAIKSADGLVIALIGIYLCHLWVKYNGEFVLDEKQLIQ